MGITIVSVDSGALVDVNEISSADVDVCTMMAVGSDSGAQAVTPIRMRSTKPGMILVRSMRHPFFPVEGRQILFIIQTLTIIQAVLHHPVGTKVSEKIRQAKRSGRRR